MDWRQYLGKLKTTKHWQDLPHNVLYQYSYLKYLMLWWHVLTRVQSPSRQKSHGFVLLVYLHLAEVFCYTWISVKFFMQSWLTFSKDPVGVSYLCVCIEVKDIPIKCSLLQEVLPCDVRRICPPPVCLVITDTNTDRANFIPSTADTEGNKPLQNNSLRWL